MACTKCGALHLCDDTAADRDLEELADGTLSDEGKDRLAAHLFGCEMHRIVFESIMAERGVFMIHDGTELRLVHDSAGRHRA